MRKNLFNKRYSALSRSKSMWVGLSAVLLLSNIFLSLCLIFKNEKVIVIPTGLKESVWIENNRVDPAYVEEMSEYFLHLALHTTPSSAAYHHKTLLKHVYPAKYGAVKAHLMNEAKRLKKDNVSTLFKPRSIKVLKDGKTVRIVGAFATFVGNKRISDEEKTFVLKTLVLKGRIFLNSLIQEQKNV